MPEEPKREDETRQEFLATMRASVGEKVFDAASPAATIRQASTAHVIHSNLPTVRATTMLSQGAAQAVDAAAKSLGGKSGVRVVPGTTTLSRFTEYTVQSMVGKGGMGQVYVAGQNALRREVAIKK